MEEETRDVGRITAEQILLAYVQEKIAPDKQAQVLEHLIKLYALLLEGRETR